MKKLVISLMLALSSLMLANVYNSTDEVPLHSSFVERFSKETQEDIKSIIYESDNRFQKLWAKYNEKIYMDPKTAKTKVGSHYGGLFKGKIRLEEDETLGGLFHEIGHRIDNLIGMSNSSLWQKYINEEDISANYKSETYNSKLRTMILSEFQDYYNEVAQRIGSYSKEVVYSAIKKEFEKYDDKLVGYRAVSDMFSGATNNELNIGYYHDAEYWKSSKSALPNETFAHFIRVLAVGETDNENLIKTYFPKSYAIFLEIVNKAGNNEKVK